MQMDSLRNLVAIINRKNGMSAGDQAKLLYSYCPPYKGTEPKEKVYSYPTQLSGLHEEEKKQTINITGNTTGGQAAQAPIGGIDL
jgi:hypothetical protein